MTSGLDTAGPVTRAESSVYRETSSYADVLEFIERLRGVARGRMLATDFGTTPEGRSLPLLIVSTAGLFTPAAAASAGVPIVLVQCGIHAGEVEGKEAALMLVRDLLVGLHADLLDGIVLLVAPLFNPDGDERRDPGNRALHIERFEGQLGPEGGVGTRENAAGINLNRDYLRQASAEMRLMQARVCHPWNPHLIVDCHTTNGSIHRFAMSVDVPHTVDSGRREPIEYMRSEFLPEVMQAVRQIDGLDSFWYGNFQRDEGGVGTGWITYPHHPRFGGNYRGLTNRLDLLLETYSYQDFATRVRTTYAFLRESLRSIKRRDTQILSLLEASALPPPSIAVGYRLEACDAPARILTRAPYRLDGAPVAIDVPHLARFTGERVVQRPMAYAVPPHVAQHLRAHGLTVEEPQGAALSDVEVAVVRDTVEAHGRSILESQVSTHLAVEWRRGNRRLPTGWRFVRTAQPRGAIAVYLCEPQSDDGLFECGLIDMPPPGAEFPAWRVHALG